MTTAVASAPVAVQRQKKVRLFQEDEVIHVSGAATFSGKISLRSLLYQIGVGSGISERFLLNFSALVEEGVPAAKLVPQTVPVELSETDLLLAYGEKNLERPETVRIPLVHFLQALVVLKERGKTGRYIAYVKGEKSILRVTACLRPAQGMSKIGADFLEKSAKHVIHKHAVLIAH